MVSKFDPQGVTLNQVAISGRKDLSEAEKWYADGLGFKAMGSTAFAGPDIAEVQGIDAPTADLEVAWIVDRNDFMQIEYMKFKEPEVRPKREGWTPADVGYNVVGVHVNEFDETLAKLAELETEPTTEPVGPMGDRRVCVKDPNGILIELMELDVPDAQGDTPANPELRAAIRFIRATVPDLERSKRFFIDAIGLQPVDLHLHGPAHEAMWGLDTAPESTLTLTPGNDRFIELVQYPGISKGWPDDYRISDEGILNIAFGSLDAEPYRALRERVIEAGSYAVHREMSVPPALSLNYVNDDQGFSVELMHMGREMHADFGYLPISGENP